MNEELVLLFGLYFMILLYLFHGSYIIILPDRVQLKADPNLIGCGHLPVIWMARGGNQVTDVDGIRQCSKQRFSAYAILMYSREYK